MPLRVVDMNKPGALRRVAMGEEEGTVVRREGGAGNAARLEEHSRAKL